MSRFKEKQLKKITIFLMSLLFVSLAFTDTDVYAGADKETAAIIAEVDRLSEQQKYETAFKKLLDAKRNEYIINKQVEFCTNYFAQSLMHQMFAFKDLEETETLHDVRTGGKQVLNLVLFDPVKVIEEYEKEYGEIPLLQKALGDYYCDIVYRYPGTWLLSEEEIVAKSIYHLEKAAAKMVLNSSSYCHLGEMYFRRREIEKAISAFKQAVEQDSRNPVNHHNLALAYVRIQDFEAAISEAELASTFYEDNDSKVNALFLASQIAMELEDASTAINYLEAAKKFNKENYIPYQNLMAIYLIAGDVKNADANADAFFGFGPANPYAGQTVMNVYLDHGKVNELKRFFDRNLKKYSTQNDVLSNLYFYYMYMYITLEDMENVKKYASLAKEYFEKAGNYTEELKEILAPYL